MTSILPTFEVGPGSITLQTIESLYSKDHPAPLGTKEGIIIASGVSKIFEAEDIVKLEYDQIEGAA